MTGRITISNCSFFIFLCHKIVVVNEQKPDLFKDEFCFAWGQHSYDVSLHNLLILFYKPEPQAVLSNSPRLSLVFASRYVNTRAILYFLNSTWVVHGCWPKIVQIARKHQLSRFVTFFFFELSIAKCLCGRVLRIGELIYPFFFTFQSIYWRYWSPGGVLKKCVYIVHPAEVIVYTYCVLCCRNIYCHTD